MTTLPALTPDSTGTVSGVTDQAGGSTGLHTVVTDSSDSTYLTSGVDAGGDVLLGLSDVPGDFDSMDTLGYSARLRLEGTVDDDTMTLTATVYDGNSTTTALTDTVTVATEATAGATFNVKTGPFAIQGTPSKAQWNSAHLRLVWTYSKTKGSDGLAIRVSETSVTGTYTAGASTFTGDATSAPAALAAPTQDGSGTHTAPTFSGTATSSPSALAAPSQDASGYAGYAAVVMSDSPVAYWRLGEASGSTAVDETGTYPGTYNGTVGYGATGLVEGSDTAVTFSGDDYVDGGDVALSTTATSVEMWLEPSTSGVRRDPFGKYDTAGSKRAILLYIDAADKPHFTVQESGSAYDAATDIASPDALVSGSTYHVVGVFASTTRLELWVDGVKKAELASGVPTDFDETDTPVLIGTGDLSTSTKFSGVIDEVALYSSALTSTQVSDHYAAGSGNTFTGTATSAPAALAAPSQSASGTFDPGTFTGTATSQPAALSGPSQAASGTHTAPTFTGDATSSPDALAAPTQDASGTTATGYAAVVLDDSPVGYWRLGESSGTTAVDETGNNDGTYVGSPTLGVSGAIAGDSDTAVDFDGTDDAVTITATTVVSLSAWVDVGTVSSSDYIVGGTLQGFRYNDTDGFLLFCGGTGYTTVPYTQASGWIHLAVVRTGTRSYDVYVDGSYLGTADPGDDADAVVVSHIGGRPDGFHFDGPIDELALFDYQLTSTQISEHYAAGTGNTFTGSATSQPSALAAPTQDASGSFDPGTFTGTATSAPSALSAPTQDASGSHVAPTFAGTATSAPSALAAPTQAADGTFVGPGVSGTATSTAVVLAAPSQDATGAHVAPTFSGTATSTPATLAAPTQDASGTHSPPVFTGTATSTPVALAAPSQDATGTYVAPGVTGTATTSAPALAAPAQDADGTTTAPTFTGTATSTPSALSAPGQSASGSFTSGSFSGTAATSAPALSAPSQAAAGVVVAPTFSGTIAQAVAALTSPTIAAAGVFSDDPPPVGGSLVGTSPRGLTGTSPTRSLTRASSVRGLTSASAARSLTRASPIRSLEPADG